MRKDAFELLEAIPEDKLTFIIQIMEGVNGLYKDDRAEREAAFERLESKRKKSMIWIMRENWLAIEWENMEMRVLVDTNVVLDYLLICGRMSEVPLRKLTGI